VRVWVSNPMERFGKYFEDRKGANNRTSCFCSRAKVSDPNYKAELVRIVTRRLTYQYKILW
jgi:hypothetical protein